MGSVAEQTVPVPVYEFRVTGEIGPVIRSAVPQLTADASESTCVLSGSVDGPVGLARLLDRLAELHLVEAEIRIHRATGAPALSRRPHAATAPDGIHNTLCTDGAEPSRP